MTSCGIPISYNASKEWADKKVVLFSVPGAFTPTCSERHLPGYLTRLGDLKGKGVDVVAVVASNDPFVMSAWGKANGVKDEVVCTQGPPGSYCDLPIDSLALPVRFRCAFRRAIGLGVEWPHRTVGDSAGPRQGGVCRRREGEGRECRRFYLNIRESELIPSRSPESTPCWPICRACLIHESKDRRQWKTSFIIINVVPHGDITGSSFIVSLFHSIYLFGLLPA